MRCVSHRFGESDPGRGAFSLRPFDGADAEPHGAEEARDGGRRSTRITATQVRLRQAVGGLLAEVGNQAVGPTPCPRMCGVKRRPFICFSWLFCLLPSSFLALMQEKKQKKIKASGTPAKFETSDYSRCTRPNFPALGRGPFLVLIEEKKQKKIKASGTPAKFGGVPDGGRPFWEPSAILDVPSQTSLPSAEGFFLS